MRYSERVVADRFTDIDYHQFTQGPSWQMAMRVAGVLTWPVVLPLALLSRLSDFIFRTCSDLLSIVPYMFGIIMRYEFYKWTLTRIGKNVVIGFGTIFFYPDIEIGDNVLIGNYNVIHYCNFGSYVLTADQCQFLSGAKYHNYDRTDIPMALQGGKIRRIQVNDDCWIGANSVIMNDIGQGSIIGAGSVVTHLVEPYTIVAGNPVQVIRRRQ
jgi:acetyltransferase-like isoleucine patch superfamily enzyme